MRLYPAILTDDIKQVQQILDQLQPVEPIKTVQIDVLDGQFADNMTVTPLDLVDLDFGRLKIDFHLMVREPMDSVQEMVEIKDRLPVRAVIGQVEQMSHQHQFVAQLEKHQWQAGLALNVFTPLTTVEPDLWSKLPLVQLLGVEAGFQGQELKPLLFEKIKQLRQLDHDPDLEIMVDGGVKLEHITQLKELGVDSVAVGSAIVKQENLVSAAQSFLDQLED